MTTVKPIRPKPWHAEALRLHALGHTAREIGDAVGKHRNTILWFLSPTARQREIDRRAGRPSRAKHPPKPLPTKSRKCTEPWHFEAKVLFSQLGRRYAEIGRRLGINKDRVLRFLDYEAHVRYNERNKQHYKDDERYRETCKARARERHHRNRAALRQQAAGSHHASP